MIRAAQKSTNVIKSFEKYSTYSGKHGLNSFSYVQTG